MTRHDPDELFSRALEASLNRRELLLGGLGLGLVPLLPGAAFAAESADAQDAVSAAGRTLRIGPAVGGPGSGFADPAFLGSPFQGWYIDGIFEPLFTYRPGTIWKPVNVLAESVEPSSNGRRIAFELKSGIPFQRGFGEVTADDVKYSFERVAGIQKPYPGATKKDASPYQTQWGALQQVRVTGKYKGIIELKEPGAGNLMRLTLPYSSTGLIVSKKAMLKFGKNRALRNPVGSGPYELTSYQVNKGWTVSRRDDRWPKHWNRPLTWDEIKVIWGGSGTTGQAATLPLEAGEVDFAPGVTALDAERLKDHRNIKIQTIPTTSYTWLSMNVMSPKLKDIRVRQAIRQAINVADILKLARLPASARIKTIIGKGFGQQFVWQGAPTYGPNTDLAKDLLRQAGVTDLELSMANTVYPEVPGISELVQEQLGSIGIKVKILDATPDDWYSNPNSAELSLFTFGGAPDPWQVLQWFTCDQVIKGYNASFWCNPEYTKLWKQLGTSINQKARAKMVIRMQQLMAGSAAFDWLYNPSYYYASSKKVTPVFDGNGNPYPTWFRAS